MRDKRLYKRFEVNCEVEFTANGIIYRGITQDLSLNGLSIRTEHQFGPDTILDIVIELPDNKTSKLKAKVVRTIKNGVGVEIIEKDSGYLHYYSNCLLGPGTDTDSS
jgi:hypothetical protein